MIPIMKSTKKSNGIYDVNEGTKIELVSVEALITNDGSEESMGKV